MRKPLLYLLLITIFGAIARLWFFWVQPFHTDEQFTLDLVRHNATYILQYAMTTDCNPPLYYLFDHLSVLILGPNAFAERYPAVIFGILMIPATYLLGKEYKDELLGLLSALAVATLGSLWYYSQFGRAYSLECLLMIVFMIFWVRTVRGTGRMGWNYLHLALMTVLLAYTHLYSLVMTGLLLLYVLWIRRLEFLKWLGIPILACAPLLILFQAIAAVRTAPRSVVESVWGWYGATIPQLIVFAPLEYFSYNFVFWVPMIAYAAWICRKKAEVVVVVGTFVVSYLLLLALSDSTPVMLRYILALVPVLLVIGLLPVVEFLERKDVTKEQKWVAFIPPTVAYFAVTIFAFATGLYVNQRGL